MLSSNKSLFLLIILLLGILFCSFLGGMYCSFKEGFDSSSNTVYYGQNGGTATITTANNVYTITVNDISGNTTVYTYNLDNTNSPNESIQDKTFTGTSGGTAKITQITNSDNNNSYYGVQVTTPNGDTYIYTSNNQNNNSQNNNNNSQNNNNNNQNNNNNNNQNNNSQNNNYNQPPPPPPSYIYDNNSTYPSNSTSANYYSNNTNKKTNYDDYLPPGIMKNMIPYGQEDLYILKSEVIPPICPACPTSSACPRKEKCPPCPACARCPEPAFDCKKVPNYNSTNNQYLPIPVLNDFSSFGM